jgi:uncharacterized protein
MHVDAGLALAGLFVGFTVGLTGMGGGALMTPMLVLLFNVQPLAAVSSDLVASFVMKPVGGGVHLRRGTVNLRLVGWLCIGSVPSAFAGVLVLRALGDDTEIQDLLETLLGVALLVAATTIVLKAILQRRRRVRTDEPVDVREVAVRPMPTVAIGVLGGLVVGMTSVGSGSLMIVLLLVLYPRLTTSGLVGTDLVQAVPLVGAAALGHLLFGDFRLAVAGSLLIGAIPGVYAGAHLSSRSADHLVRPVLVTVLAASALRLLGVAPEVVGGLLIAAATAGLVVVLRAFRTRRHAEHRESEPAPEPTRASP